MNDNPNYPEIYIVVEVEAKFARQDVKPDTSLHIGALTGLVCAKWLRLDVRTSC